MGAEGPPSGGAHHIISIRPVTLPPLLPALLHTATPHRSGCGYSFVWTKHKLKKILRI